MAFIEVSELKKQLNIELDFTEDDGYLATLTDVAEQAIKSYCNGGLDTVTNAPTPVKQAALLLAAHLYLSRTTVSFAQGYEIPYSFKFLLNPYRVFTIS